MKRVIAIAKRIAWGFIYRAARHSEPVREWASKKFVTNDVVLLLMGVEISQNIYLRQRRPSGIAIQFATFGRKNSCDIEVVVSKSTGEILHYEKFPANSLNDNEYYWLNFPKIKEVAAADNLKISIRSNGFPGNCVALWRARAGGDDIAVCFTSGVNSFSSCDSSNSLFPGGQLALFLQTNSEELSYIKDYPLGEKREVFCDQINVLYVGDAEFIKRGNRLDKIYIVNCKAENLNSEYFNRVAVDVILFQGSVDIEKISTISIEARRRSIPVFFLEVSSLGEVGTLTRSLSTYANFTLKSHGDSFDLLAPDYFCGDLSFERAISRGIELHKKTFSPKVSLVTILHAKAAQLQAVIESYFRQTYGGQIEIIFVDDASETGESRLVADIFSVCRERSDPAVDITYRLVVNDENLGNCISRNRGVDAATGDIIVIIDADCMINKEFIQGHVDAHSYMDCDVVIGPHNIETNGAAPLDFLEGLESSPERALLQSELQDHVNLHSFLNCITRNFSIKRTSVSGPLFDPDFSYSRDPKTGFGWEDVEMGYRLYERGLRIKFTTDAFSVHISHESGISDIDKLRRSVKNFRKLFDKHDEFAFVARRWACEKWRQLLNWEARLGVHAIEHEDRRAVDAHLRDAPSQVGFRSGNRRLRILTYRWHVPHQYELYKSPHDFFLVTGLGVPMGNWEYGQRPKPSNASFISVDKVDLRDYDLAILHFDENVLSPEHTNGMLDARWGAAFQWFVEQVNLPKVAVCHGTPQFYGQYNARYEGENLLEVIESSRLKLVEYVKDIEVVCNSYQAQAEWGFARSRVIWHGFDPSEFPRSNYTKGILSPLGPLVTSRPHYRGLRLYQEVFNASYPNDYLPSQLAVPEPHLDYQHNVYAVAKYRNYVDELRNYSIYFNPTLRSPMPRARAEPMMCGVVTVNAKNHDVDLFIKNGVNGFYSNDADELRDQLLFLMRNPKANKEIGARARRTAIDVFNHDRYLSDWSSLLGEVN